MSSTRPLLACNGPIDIQPLENSPLNGQSPYYSPPHADHYLGCPPPATTSTSPSYMAAPGMLPYPALPGGIVIKPEPVDNFTVSNVSIPDDQNPQSAQADASKGSNSDVQVTAAKPKRVRKRKIKEEPKTVGFEESQNAPVPAVPIKKEIKQEKITGFVKEKKKRDRFKGMTEEEVLKRTLPDHLDYGLDIAIVGINPGLTAAFVGHHYAGPGNHFWKCLFLSGLIPEPMNAYDDAKLKNYGIGFTNIVERTSRGSADLTKKEIKEGGEILKAKIKKYKPKIAAFNGKGIYEVFCGHKNFIFGKQPDPFPGSEDTVVWVMPSSSARCTQLPRAVDKVPFYLALKKLKDSLNNLCPTPDVSEITFPDLELKTAVKPKPEGWVKPEPRVKKEPAVKKEPRVKKEPGTGVKGAKPKAPRKRKTKKEIAAEKAAAAAAALAPTVNTSPVAAPATAAPPASPDGAPGSTPVTTSSSGSFLEMLFSSPQSLVKQEDASELAAYGILPNMTFPNATRSLSNPITQAAAGYSQATTVSSAPVNVTPSWQDRPPVTVHSPASHASTVTNSGASHTVTSAASLSPTYSPEAKSHSPPFSKLDAPHTSSNSSDWHCSMPAHTTMSQQPVAAHTSAHLARPIPYYPPAWGPPPAHMPFPAHVHQPFPGQGTFPGQGPPFFTGQGHLPYPGMAGFPVSMKPEPSSEGYGQPLSQS